MAEEEEDKLLLSRLGVTSANAEEVEHDVLKKMENDALCTKEDLEDRPHDEEHGREPSSATYTEISTKLQAVTAEIGVHTASINHIKNFDGCENNCSADIDVSKGNIEHLNDSDSVRMTTDGLTIQQALASERLRDLQITKARLQNEITRFEKDMPVDNIGDGTILEKLVKDEPKKKHKSKGQSSKNSKRKAVAYDDDVEFDAMLDAATCELVETERDKLVRKGILTPFHSLKGLERRVQQPESSSRSHPQDDEGNESLASASIAKVARSISEIAQSRSATKLVDAKSLPKLEGPTHHFERLRSPLKRPISPDELGDKGRKKTRKLRRPLPDKKWRKKVEIEDILQNEVDEDEGRDSVVLDNAPEENDHEEDSDSGRESCVVLEGGLRIPETIYSKLFDYQKVGVQWLWELHCQRAGGIIGDEMGLGKTVQVLSFLGALHFSKKYKPSIVICPVTLLRQWQREAKKWYPKFHVEILHDSAHGSAKSEKPKASDSGGESEEGSLDSENGRDRHKKSRKRWNNLIHSVLNSKSGLLLTTYEQLRIFREKLLDIEWGYAILDEGHRIRNPNAEVTLLCKQLQTVHRVIMTGAPIQNKLAELWSLFDFIFPGKLGVLPVFEMEFAVPISVGGYANATPLQVSTAYRCAVVLRDLIMPYLLRRMKADVNAHLTTKTEHVLFCSLTTDQRSLYRAFLASSEVEQIFDGSRNSLYGIDIMRKICNHPDLLEREHAAKHPDYGNPDRSGKLKVVAQVLELWKEQGHRVLLFTQTQQMLDIFEIFLNTSGYTYRRMDGLTPIKHRMALIDEFNNSTEVFVFILTTKVGGLGTNLTGANRVIIYDPDWNPSTDMQARERAWRIGQTRDVTVYRLITRGTIEEKVYHRQIYKHFLTNKILKNPQQKRFFKARDMRDLFTLQDDGGDNSTETSNIFGQLPGDVSVVLHGDNKGTQMPLPVPPVSTCDIVETGSSDPGKDTSKVKGNTEAGEGDEETNILKSLFSAQGIHSVVNHDVIMSANDDDRVKMEEQASLVAQRAAEALRQSRLLRSHDNFSVPTWTGKSGAAGAPSYVRKKFGSTVNTKLLGTSNSSSDKSICFQVGASTGKALSSAALLARTRGNREKAACDGLEHQLGLSSNTRKLTPASGQHKSLTNNIVQPEVLIRQLCTFIQQRGGRADSGSIVQHFKDRIPTKDLPLFRGLLKEIAVLEKDAGLRGSHWVLKPEYVE